MLKKSASIFTRLIALVLVFSLTVPVYCSAATVDAVEPRASAYLTSYGAYVYLPGNGQVQVYFNVTGTGYMDELGALAIYIYESIDGTSWTWKKTFMHDTTAGLLSYNDNYHSGYVSYNGVAGRYYKAYVCIWGGKDGQGDTRYFWTSAKH
jgi:hypothetical protein